MKTILCIIATSLIPGLLIFGIRAYRNYLEIKALERNGYRRVAARRLSNRGSAGLDFMRGVVELGVILLLLIAVMGWLAHSTPQ